VVRGRGGGSSYLACGSPSDSSSNCSQAAHVSDAKHCMEKELGSPDPAVGRAGLWGQTGERVEENPDLVAVGAELVGAERSVERRPRAHPAMSWVARHASRTPRGHAM
jgi:hypothetical protein